MPRRKNITEEKKDDLKNEVKYLATAAVGILLLLTVFLNNSMGPVGVFVRNFLVGFFGFGAFVLPAGILIVSVFKLISREIKLPIVKIIFLFWFILSLLHIFIYKADENLFIFSDVYKQGLDSGGGIFGVLIGGLAEFLLGTVGATIALVSGVIILAVMITKRSLIQIVESVAGKIREYYVESRRYEEEAEREFKNREREKIIPLRSEREKIIPLRSERKNKKNQPVEFVDVEESEIPEPGSGVRLLGEELGEHFAKKHSQNPLFAERKPISETIKKHPAVVTFPATLHDENYDDEIYDDDEEFYEDKFYDDEKFYDENFPAQENNFPEDEIEYVYDDEPVVLPIDINYASDFVEPVVKGMVENAAASEEIYYDDEYDDDDYDSREKKHSYEDYQLPSLNLLAKNERPTISAESRTQVLENSRILEETLRSFKIEAKVVEVSVGPTVTRYDLSPGQGVKVSSIVNLSNDLALSLAAQGLRIEAPVPGKSAVGIEIPNKEPQGVFLREILEDERFLNFPSKLAFAVGKDIAGSPIITDVSRMPHLLIAGATGSGKSVCINTLITSLLYKARPDEVKLLMIDPKVVELSVYNGIPHLLIPVVTDPKKASGALNWAVAEMETRYNLFAEAGVRDIKGYNKYAADEGLEELFLIVIIIDELADLMMTCKGEVEESICRIAQKARAAGMHLIVATQRPSVDVITGLIKANIPSRLAFAVSSGTDSRTVLDMYGAEKLLGRGDMLFLPMGQNKPLRVQGGFISENEVENIVEFLKLQAPTEHSVEEIQRVTMPGKVVVEGEVDEFFRDAVDFLLTKGKGSTSMLQRQFRIGYNRASRLMDDLEARGIVGPEDGVKPRKVTMTREEFRELYG